MGIDLNKMRQKHAALTNRGGDTNDFFWKPEEGTHQVRLVCPEGGDPFFEAYYHYSMGAEGRTTVLSPRTFGEDDPIAEWGTRLWNEGTDASKEAAKRFWPKMRVFAPIVVSIFVVRDGFFFLASSSTDGDRSAPRHGSRADADAATLASQALTAAAR